jgi:hypothetical protein
MLRIFAAIVALCAYLFVRADWRHEQIGDPRRASRRAVKVALVVFLASFATAAFARPSPYPPVTQFNGDRYPATAQMGADVARAVKAKTGAKPRVRYLYPTRKRPPVSRQKWRAVPVPAPRPLASDAYRVEAPLSVGEGVRREVKRAVGRPRAWCGWWLGQHLGMTDRKLWLARNWALVGTSVSGPRIGAIVVWKHHVGVITGQHNGQWVVKSGNDGNAVRERPRSLARAIAFRRLG